MAIQDVPILNSATIICSRLKRDETLMVPSPDTLIQHGDLLHLVGQPADLNNARLVIGQRWIPHSQPVERTCAWSGW